MSGDPEVAADSEEEHQPQVFVSVLGTPPGPPWDQQAAASLEANRAAPLPIALLALRLRRLDPWRPRAPGRFAAVYARKSDLGAGFSRTVSVDGHELTVDFRPEAQVRQQAQRGVVLLVAAAVAAFSLVVATAAALSERAAGDRRLTEAEAIATRNLRLAQSEAPLKRQSIALGKVADRGRPLDIVLGDLAAASRAKAPETTIEGFHWRLVGMAVETRGDQAPLSDSRFRRIDKPLRPGVWLWAAVPDAEKAKTP